MLFVTDAGSGANGAAGGIVGLSVSANCTLQVAWSAPLGGNTQPNSTPTVAGGVVFVGEGNGGRVHAFDAGAGTPLWDSGFLISGATYAAPVVAQGVLYVASWNGFGTADGGTVRAFGIGTPNTTVLLGDQAVEGQIDSNSMGKAEAFQAAAAAGGTVLSLTVYLDATSTATSLVAGIYSDVGGHPGALLAQGSGTSLSAGAWNKISLPTPGATVSAGMPYWIAILGTQSGTPRFRDRSGGCLSETSSQAALTALPASWTTGVVYNDCPLSAYGSATP